MRTLHSLALVVVLGFGLAGCKKPKHALEYTEASGQYTTLLAQLGDAAYADEEMDRIVDLLKKVPPESLDAQASNELLSTIAGERRRIADEERARARAAAVTPEVQFDPPSQPEPVVVPDAGRSGELFAGMTLDELRRATDGCFSSTGPLKLRNPDRTETDAEMYEPVAEQRCRARYAKYDGHFLVFKEGKLVGDFDKAALLQLAPQKPAVPAAPPAAPPPAPQPVVEPGGDKPPTPQPAPDNSGEQTGPAPAP
ncbi:MAG: hypothetical protein IPJ65_32750 [Archangiaceae bacterium]|nr:hypothetical protein [Archangiaceae bacterium]